LAEITTGRTGKHRPMDDFDTYFERGTRTVSFTTNACLGTDVKLKCSFELPNKHCCCGVRASSL